MNEQFIIDMLIINYVNYHKFGDEQGFRGWMQRLQELKGFATMDETCAYFVVMGGSK